ncbi:MAG: LysR substrate-binding domain-containing protein [[Pasteurella] aerogenes]|nr:LysR substrate-binding domain-containing protein [[Pasteurella] aerogenes]MCI7719530.1 LysR substrate-binding domain-containing protein [Limosilactobacillus reuteri]MDY4479896.1 LysR substrate-binding domain-containing protein [[Pasteurella] aerogenes]VEG72784.1 glycine cleavage system transcriptional activator [[Pasteurella] aerogenes]
MKLPPLEALRYFEVVARHLSFTLAADELCVSQSAVSQKILLLEDRLGYKLFYRKPRQLSLTKEGNELLRYVVIAFNQLQTAMQHIAEIQQAHTINIYCMPSMASCWLIPQLHDLYQRVPELSLNLVVDVSEPDFLDDSIDMALCHGYGDHPNTVKKLLFQDYIYPVISRELFSHYQQDPELCLRHLPLLHDSMPQAKLSTSWQQWVIQHRKNINTQTGYRYNQADLIIQAAVNGQGIALVRHVLVARYVAEGKLVPLYPEYTPDQNIYLVYRKTLLHKEYVQNFIDWIEDKARSFLHEFSIEKCCNDKYRLLKDKKS